MDGSECSMDSPRRDFRGEEGKGGHREENLSASPAGAQPTPGLWSTSRSRLAQSHESLPCLCDFGLEMPTLSCSNFVPFKHLLNWLCGTLIRGVKHYTARKKGFSIGKEVLPPSLSLCDFHLIL